MKYALVCGASKGIGFEIAKQLSNQDIGIIGIARDMTSLEHAKNQWSNPEKHLIYAVDMLDTSSLIDLVARLKEATKHPISILINNSGGPKSGLIHQAQNEEFTQAFQAHLIAAHTLTTELLPEMKAQGFGRIVNIISTSVKQPLPNLGVSNTIRAAMANWSKTMANELAQFGITVNNVLPGATKTERLYDIIQNKARMTAKQVSQIESEMLQEIPMKRFAEVAEIANAVSFLVSEKASYITGINLPVDGGRTGNL